MKESKKYSIITIVIIVLIVAVSVTLVLVKDYLEADRTPLLVNSKEYGDGDIYIHFIDVGQGDAAFIDNGDKDILIDAGPGSSADELLDYLDALGVQDIEYAFFSHPHEDHIGGADDVLVHYDVKNVVMPKKSEDSACYRSMMRTAEEESEVIYAAAGDVFEIGEMTVEIYSPESGVTEDDANLVSLIMKVSYGEVDAMFTGDAEIENELYVLDNYYDKLDCEILKVGHHGSSTSTCEEFFDAITPEIAVISVGEGNSYGHPHRETLALLNGKMDEIYRTDFDGTIIVGSDGKNFWFVE